MDTYKNLPLGSRARASRNVFRVERKGRACEFRQGASLASDGKTAIASGMKPGTERLL